MGGQTDIAYMYLKQRILDGRLKPSQKLTETELSEVIGVSRNTLKKALLKLEQENLVKIENNKGATIKSFTLEEVLNYLEIREELEGLVARSAAQHITDLGLLDMKNILKEMDVHLKNHKFDEYSNLNRKFHEVIYKASKNPQAVEVITTIKTQLIRFHFRTILVPGRNDESFSEHKQILEALKSHDQQCTERALKSHIANVRRTTRENYDYLL